jgi:hypothetical protein
VQKATDGDPHDRGDDDESTGSLEFCRPGVPRPQFALGEVEADCGEAEDEDERAGEVNCSHLRFAELLLDGEYPLGSGVVPHSGTPSARLGRPVGKKTTPSTAIPASRLSH